MPRWKSILLLLHHTAAPLFAAALLLAAAPLFAQRVYSSEEHRFRLETVVSGLVHPWAIAFLPDGDMLVTERGGAAYRWDGTTLHRLSGIPSVAVVGQGGLLDVAIHPEYPRTGLVYFTFARPVSTNGAGTAVGRARLDGTALRDWETIFTMSPAGRGGFHFGSRMAFLADGTLLVTIGDRGDPGRAQDRGDHAGSTVRITDDGGVPPDNPWPATPGVLPELYTWGNRNSQGMAVDSRTGIVWQHEHGPRGGDELNIIRPGVNYGWPVISYGADYRTGRPVGEGTEREGMAQPVVEWTPSIAPSGMALYSGTAFPRWQGNMFLGALAGQHLRRLVLEGERVIHQETLLDRATGRIRDVRQGPDGFLYLITDERAGTILRLVPDGR
jgi:aldose sugar dehydrogenase